MTDLIPQGTYEAVAYALDTEEFGRTFAQFGESKNKGTPQVVVNLEIVTEGEQAGRRIAWIGYFTDNTTQRTVESLRYMGFQGTDLAAAITQKLDRKVQIVVEHEEYDGKWRAKVVWVNRAGGGAFRLTEPMSKSALGRFAAQMKGAVQSVPEEGAPRAGGGSQQRQGAPAGRPPASSGRHRETSAPPPDDDRPPPRDEDIPF
jgi:hypothetical protein